MDRGEKILQGNPRELLSSSLESYVMEIYSVNGNDNCIIDYLNNNTIRYEFFQDTLFAYSNEQEILSMLADKLKINDYYIRHSNLEDLFLRVTGRSLNELQ